MYLGLDEFAQYFNYWRVTPLESRGAISSMSTTSTTSWRKDRCRNAQREVLKAKQTRGSRVEPNNCSRLLLRAPQEPALPLGACTISFTDDAKRMLSSAVAADPFEFVDMYADPTIQFWVFARWTGAANVDLNRDGVSDLLIGGFLVPGLYIIAGDDGGPRSMFSAVVLAIVSGVLGCLFCVARELRVWVSKSLLEIFVACSHLGPLLGTRATPIVSKVVDYGYIVFLFLARHEVASRGRHIAERQDRYLSVKT